MDVVEIELPVTNSDEHTVKETIEFDNEGISCSLIKFIE